MNQSELLFQRGCACIPGGVNSPVRAFAAVGGKPLYVSSGAGARITTVDGQCMTDYCGSWGPLILGHAHPEVVAAIQQAAARGSSFGINTAAEVEFAEQLTTLIPYLEKVRLVNSGTESVMTALRLARGATGRRLIVKFQGGYHGHSDSLLAAAGSGLLTGGVSSSAGVSAAVAAETLLPAYNDLAAVAEIAAQRGHELAAIIVEPVAGNMGLVKPAPGFLEGLRQICNRCQALLIFDEVITGFRAAATTYGALAGITADITCLGKIIGGGMPIGAIGGSAELMDNLAPLGPVYQAGTLSGNPVAVAAGLAVLRILQRDNPYPRLAALAQCLADGVTAAASKHALPMHCATFAGMFTPFFCAHAPTCLAEVQQCNTAAFARFFCGMRAHGIYLSPSQFECNFISSAHTAADIEAFIAAAEAVLAEIA